MAWFKSPGGQINADRFQRIPAHGFIDTKRTALSVITRGLKTRMMAGAVDLSIPAIVGIAVGGAILLGFVLAFSLWLYARSHDQRQKVPDAEVQAADVRVPEAASSRPSQECQPKRTPSKLRKKKLGSKRSIDTSSLASAHGSESTLIRPPGPSRTGSHGNWPIRQAAEPQNYRGPVGFEGRLQCVSCSSLHAPWEGCAPGPIPSPTWPPRTHSKMPRSYDSVLARTQLHPVRPCPKAAELSRQASKRFKDRGSSPEYNLTSILRSTSQRLSTVSRTRSILDQSPGAPPTQKLPTLPQPSTGPGKSETIAHDSRDESVNSSVLDMFARASCTPKLQARSSGSAWLPQRNGHDSMSTAVDSLLQCDSPDLMTMALTSPSRHAQSMRRSHMWTTAVDSLGAMDEYHQRQASGGSHRHQRQVSGGSHDEERQPRIPSIGFATMDIPIFHESAKSSTIRPVPLSPPEKLQRTPTKASPRNNQLPKDTPSVPFQWSPDLEKKLKARNSFRNSHRVGGKKQGHKRSKVVRMSGLPRVSSISVVTEETDDDATTATGDSPTSVYSKTFSDRTPMPPSVPTFNPVLKSNRPSAQYSSTMSVFDYYTDASEDTTDEPFNKADGNDGTDRKARRKGSDVSELGWHWRQPNLVIHELDELDTNESETTLPGLSKDAIPHFPPPPRTTSRPSYVRPQGPRNQPRRPNSALEHFVSDLRRTNSQISVYDSEYTTSTGFESSPTIPQLQRPSITGVSRDAHFGKQRVDLSRPSSSSSSFSAAPQQNDSTKAYLTIGTTSSAGPRRSSLRRISADLAAHKQNLVRAHASWFSSSGVDESPSVVSELESRELAEMQSEAETEDSPHSRLQTPAPLSPRTSNSNNMNNRYLTPSRPAPPPPKSAPAKLAPSPQFEVLNRGAASVGEITDASDTEFTEAESVPASSSRFPHSPFPSISHPSPSSAGRRAGGIMVKKREVVIPPPVYLRRDNGDWERRELSAALAAGGDKENANRDENALYDEDGFLKGSPGPAMQGTPRSGPRSAPRSAQRSASISMRAQGSPIQPRRNITGISISTQGSPMAQRRNLAAREPFMDNIMENRL